MKQLLQIYFIFFLTGCACIKSPSKFREKYYLTNQDIAYYCGNIDKLDKIGHTLLMEAVIYGKNQIFIEQCLEKKANVFLVDNTGFSACNYITFPSLYEPKNKKNIKNSNDIILIIKLFVKYNKKFESKIYEETLWSLIRYNKFKYSGEVFDYLMSKMTVSNTKLDIINNVINRDITTKAMWNDNWKPYIED